MAGWREKSPLCSLADWFPNYVAAELEEARSLRHQSRETSWTDRMLLELRKLRDPRIIVQNSNERLTGADMDWHFVSANGRRHLHLAVQAKILHYTMVRAPLRYGDLAYPNRTGRQSRQLTNYARRQGRKGLNTYPLYLFYNPASVSNWATFCSPGISLANAYRIRHHLDTMQRRSTDSKVPLQATEFGVIEPLMFCLHRIFCEPSDFMPGPDDVAAALAEIDIQIGHISPGRQRPPIPEAGEKVPREILRIVDLMRDGMSHAAKFDSGDDGPRERPRVIFIGGDS